MRNTQPSSNSVDMAREDDPRTGRRIDPRMLVLNTMTSYLDRFIDVMVFIVLIPYVLSKVGKDQYGIWVLVWSIMHMLALVDMGFGTSVVKYVAESRGREDPERLQNVVCTLFWIFVAEGLVLVPILAGLSTTLGTWLDIPAAKLDVADTVLLVVGFGFAIRFPLSMFRGILVGHQKLWIANVYKSMMSLVYFGAVPLALSRWPDLRAFALVNLIISVGPALAVAIHAYFTTTTFTLNPRYFRRDMMKELWSFSFYFMLIQIAVLIATRIDAFVINAFLPLGAVATYGLAMRVSEQAQGVCAQIARTLTPVVAELDGAAEEARLRSLWLQSSKIIFAFSAPLLVGCALLAEPLIVQWAGPDYRQAATVLQLLLIANVIGIVHSHSHDQLAMRREQRTLSFAMIAGQTINLLLSIALIQVWGIVGVALATITAPLFIDVGVVQGRLGRRYSVTRWSFYRQTALPSVIPLLLMSAAFTAWRYIHPIESLWEVGLVEAAGVLLFWTAFWFTGLSTPEREGFRARLRRRMPTAEAKT